MGMQAGTHQQLRGRFPEGYHPPGRIQAALLPLRHEADCLAEARQPVPHACMSRLTAHQSSHPATSACMHASMHPPNAMD